MATSEIEAYGQFDEMSKILHYLDYTEDEEYYNIVLEQSKCNLYELIQACKNGVYDQ
jgi:hypothetical protein